MTRHSGHICILKLPFSLHFTVLCPLSPSKSCDPARRFVGFKYQKKRAKVGSLWAKVGSFTIMIK